VSTPNILGRKFVEGLLLCYKIGAKSIYEVPLLGRLVAGGVDSVGSGYGPVAASYQYGDERRVLAPRELVIVKSKTVTLPSCAPQGGEEV
jgi:hypothetical protein